MRRKRFFRAVRVKLDCGCTRDLDTGRYRVSRALAVLVVNHAVRHGEWCFKHNGECMPVEVLGVVRQ